MIVYSIPLLHHNPNNSLNTALINIGSGQTLIRYQPDKSELPRLIAARWDKSCVNGGNLQGTSCYTACHESLWSMISA